MITPPLRSFPLVNKDLSPEDRFIGWAEEVSRLLNMLGNDEISVMLGLVEGQRIINKYGINADVDTAEDIWDGGGDYTGFPTATAENFEVLSTDANDTIAGTGARKVRIWYYDDDTNMFQSNGNFYTVDVDLNGTTGVDAGVSGMRVWRVKVIESGSGQINAGVITVRWITTTSVIFSQVRAGTGQSEITSFTVPNGYRGYLKLYGASMNDNTSNRAEIALKVRDPNSNTWRLTRPFVVTTDKDFTRDMYGGEEMGPKSDFVFRCTAITNANGVIPIDYGVHLVKL